MDNKYIFKIFIAGIAPDNQVMIASFKKQLADMLGEGNFKLEVIDLLENPELAEEEHILATPTVVRKLPKPIKKVILSLDEETESILGFEVIIRDE
jgi:circadian clock protein KaiB